MIKIKAIVLAAGYATRLYPLTKWTPKPLLSIAGKPIIEHILLKMDQLPIDEIFIVTNDVFYKKFIHWQSGFKTNKKIKIINDQTKSNEERLGAIGDIHFVISNEHIDDDILVVAGDNLFDFNLQEFNEFFQNRKASVVALHDFKNKSVAARKYGIVELDGDLRIIGFEEKPEQPKTSLVSTACYIFSQTDLRLLEHCIAEHKKPDNLGDFIKWLSEQKHVYGYVFAEKWFDIGDHIQLQEAYLYWSAK